MSTKRILVFVGAAVFTLILAAGVTLSLQGQTVDCRGTVTAIAYNQDDRCTYITVNGVFDGPVYTIKAGPDISVKSTSGGQKQIADIQVGDEGWLDHWGTWKDAQTPLTAKWIKFMPASTGA